MKHLAIIMDGNRRWARKKGLATLIGHRKGSDSIEIAMSFCLKHTIPYLSLYTFSIENFNRSAQERAYLFDLIKKGVKQNLDQFIKNKVRVCFVGERSLFPEEVLPAIEEAERATAQFNALQVNFLFCYGARQEIVHGIRHMVRKIQAGELSEEDISEDMLSHYLWTAGMPEPDLIIRTGGQKRLSNFLLYQAAYSEFQFLDCYWPDITEQDLDKSLSTFNECKRNFGA